jgi:NAD(P)-dependent dehydrogenase (short-subunit alcohol dehydrogenase family)
VSVAVVTGGNRGLGLEICRQLAGVGHTVVLGSRDRANGERAAAELEGDVHVVELDVADAGSVLAAAEEVERSVGGADVVVNNAAILYDTSNRAESVELAVVHEGMETNLFGAWRTTQAFLPLLRRSEHPRIVNVSSGGGQLSGMGGGTPTYGVSKAALNALTLKLADELRGEGFLVNAVCPGWTATDMGGGGRPVPEGAAGIVWAATLGDDGPTGGFFRDGQPLEW